MGHGGWDTGDGTGVSGHSSAGFLTLWLLSPFSNLPFLICTKEMDLRPYSEKAVRVRDQADRG